MCSQSIALGAVGPLPTQPRGVGHQRGALQLQLRLLHAYGVAAVLLRAGAGPQRPEEQPADSHPLPGYDGYDTLRAPAPYALD